VHWWGLNGPTRRHGDSPVIVAHRPPGFMPRTSIGQACVRASSSIIATCAYIIIHTDCLFAPSPYPTNDYQCRWRVRYISAKFPITFPIPHRLSSLTLSSSSSSFNFQSTYCFFTLRMWHTDIRKSRHGFSSWNECLIIWYTQRQFISWKYK